MQPRERHCRWGRHGMLGRAHGRPLVRPQRTPRSQPLHTPAARSDTTPNTAAENLSAKGRISRRPAGGSGRSDRSIRDRPHPSARRPCGTTGTGHPSAGARNWHTPSTMGDQLGQPRSTRKRWTVNPPIAPSFQLPLLILKAGSAGAAACGGRPHAGSTTPWARDPRHSLTCQQTERRITHVPSGSYLQGGRKRTFGNKLKFRSEQSACPLL